MTDEMMDLQKLLEKSSDAEKENGVRVQTPIIHNKSAAGKTISAISPRDEFRLENSDR
jgi:hypothetical protein